jgi:hypothetical protein
VESSATAAAHTAPAAAVSSPLRKPGNGQQNAAKNNRQNSVHGDTL